MRNALVGQTPVGSALDGITGQVKKFWKFLIVLAILGGLFASFPHITARVLAGQNWQGVAPELMGDSLFYMTRASRAIHGDIMGNPDYLTIYNNPSPSFSLIDSIQGVPYGLLPPFWAAVLNTFLWNAIFAFLIGVLLLRLGFSRSMIILSWFVIASSMFTHMIRAGHTQIIFPYFLMFFIFLMETSRKDRLKAAGKYDAAILGIFAGFTTYFYTFLFQVVAASLAVGVALAFLSRRKQLIRTFTIAIVAMIGVATPHLVYLHGIMDFPAFDEAMNLFAGVRSHFPSPQVYFYGRWPVLLAAWSLLLWWRKVRVVRKKSDVAEEDTAKHSLEDIVLTISMVSLGTLGLMWENVITGFDISGPAHANWFVLLLVPLGLVLLAGRSVRVLFERGAYVQKALLLFCVLIVAGEVWNTIPPQFLNIYLNPSFYRSDSAGPQYVLKPAGNPQYIMPALQALDSLGGTQVIAAPEPLNAYIPLYTRQYLLFIPDGGVYPTMDIIELADRLFASKLGQPLTQEEVAEAYNWVKAPNNEIMVRDKLARELCAMVSRSPSCATLVVARPYAGDEAIDHPALFEYYQNVVRPNVVKYLHRFKVTQVVIDRRLPVPELLRKQTSWYSDEYYAIYDTTPLYSLK